MKMKPKILLLVVSITLVILDSCTKVVDDSNIPNTSTEWLQNLACALPCWQNITPQETQFEDVLPILSDTGVTVRNQEKDHISFLFEKTIPVSVYKASDSSVDFIVLFFEHEKLNIGDFEQVIGAPEKISYIRIPGMRSCQVNMLYPDQGLILEVNLENSSKGNNYLDCQIEIVPENTVNHLILIGRNLTKSELWERAASLLSVREWKGYGEYP